MLREHQHSHQTNGLINLVRCGLHDIFTYIDLFTEQAKQQHIVPGRKVSYKKVIEGQSVKSFIHFQLVKTHFTCFRIINMRDFRIGKFLIFNGGYIYPKLT